MASEQAETCRFINTNKLVVFDVPYPLLIVTYTTGMPQLRTTKIVDNMYKNFVITCLGRNRPTSGHTEYQKVR